jgi:transcriptional regulator with XRE-family HTH domain
MQTAKGEAYNTPAFPMPSVARVSGKAMPFWGENLRRLRERAGLSRQELADKMDVSLSSIESWEQNLRKPRVDALFNMAKVLKADAEEFLKTPRKKGTPGRGRPKK